MPSREEIREGIAEVIYLGHFPKKEDDWQHCNERVRSQCKGYANRVINYLHSKGVVIKVDRELPEFIPEPIFASISITEVQEGMLKAGYVAVEPLIEVKDDADDS